MVDKYIYIYKPKYDMTQTQNNYNETKITKQTQK